MEAFGEGTLKVRVGMAVEAIDDGNDKGGVALGISVPLVGGRVTVAIWAKVGVTAGAGDAQAVSKTRTASKVVVLDLIFIFTSIDNYIPCHIITENYAVKGRDEDK